MKMEKKTYKKPLTEIVRGYAKESMLEGSTDDQFARGHQGGYSDSDKTIVWERKCSPWTK